MRIVYSKIFIHIGSDVAAWLNHKQSNILTSYRIYNISRILLTAIMPCFQNLTWDQLATYSKRFNHCARDSNYMCHCYVKASKLRLLHLPQLRAWSNMQSAMQSQDFPREASIVATGTSTLSVEINWLAHPKKWKCARFCISLVENPEIFTPP